MVDLASEYDLNFVVVASRVRLGRMNAVQAMEAFGMYCCCEGDSRELQINPGYRRAQEVVNQFREKIMGNQLMSQQLNLEYSYQMNARETEACFSPIRLIQERLEQINTALGANQQPTKMMRTDFTELVQERRQAPSKTQVS